MTNIRGRAGAYLFAVVVLSAAVASAAQGPEAAYDEARKMTDAGDYDGAEKILKAQLAKDRKDYRAMTELGVVRQDTGDRKGALKLFKDAVGAEPKYLPARFFLGRLYFMMKKPGEAADEFIDFIERTKAGPIEGEMEISAQIGGLHYISEISGDIDRYDVMKSAIDAILRLDPKDQSARYNLGIYYYNGEHNRSKAYQSFKFAIDLDPNSPVAKKAKFAIEFIRANPDSRIAADMSFINQEYRE